MSKIIRFTKCEGFCKHRSNEGNERESSLLCRCTRWYLWRRTRSDGSKIDWFKQSFVERCPYINEQDYKNRK